MYFNLFPLDLGREGKKQSVLIPRFLARAKQMVPGIEMRKTWDSSIRLVRTLCLLAYIPIRSVRSLRLLAYIPIRSVRTLCSAIFKLIPFPSAHGPSGRRCSPEAGELRVAVRGMNL